MWVAARARDLVELSVGYHVWPVVSWVSPWNNELMHGRAQPNNWVSPWTNKLVHGSIRHGLLFCLGGCAVTRFCLSSCCDQRVFDGVQALKGS